jgi:hypothetical protein
MRPFTVRKPIDSPSIAPSRTSESSSRALDVRDQPAARVEPARVLAQLQPHADRLGRVVLEQHRDAADAARRQRRREGARHDHVACLVDLAEQAGIALHRAVGLDEGARGKHRRDGRFVVGCEHDSSFTSPRLHPNSGVPEFGRDMNRPKSEASDFG